MGISVASGDDRIITTRKLHLDSEQSPYMYIRAGIPVESVLTNANTQLLKNFLFLSLILVLAFLFSSFIGKRSIASRIALLENASQNLANGDYQTKVVELVQGGELGRLAEAFDIMANKLIQREEALANGERFLKTIIDSEPECIKMLDRDCNLLMMNQAGLEMIQADSFEQVKGQCVCPLITSPYKDAFIALTQQVFQGIPGKLEFETVGLKGRHAWLETHAVPFCNEQGEITALLGITRNITDRKRAEEIYRIVFSNAPIGMILSDDHSVVLECNQYVVDIFDASQEKYIGMNLLETIPQGAVRQNLLDAISDGQLHHYEGSYSSVVSGKELYISISTEKVAPDLFITLILDITERKRSDMLLRASEEKYRTLFNNAEIAMFRTRLDGSEILDVNQKLLDMLDRTLEETLGKPSAILWVDPEERAEMVRRLSADGRVSKYQYKMLDKHGVIRNCITSLVLYREQGILEGSIIDITDLKQAENDRINLEKQLLHAQKLESLGVLAGGIAHDFNNILMAIIGNADLALMRINKESPATENLHKIEQAAARAADLAKQMLAYSGKGKFVVENIDLNKLLEDMLHMLEVSISKKAILRFNLHRELPAVEADATQMRQIVMNLVINASEAIGDRSGVIAITTGCMNCDDSYLKDVWLDKNLTDGLYVYLEIADSGCGMGKETLSKLFDPFFTTKFTGRGLGMAAVLGIVRGHKGSIRVYSEPDKGTTFKILLPASNRPAEVFDDGFHHGDWKGKGIVLLVDDEETVRSIGSEMLKELGFTPITANDGREAVELYKNTPDVAFVILDLTMPHMDGEQCFRELRQVSSGVKVIMSSGFSENEVTQRFSGKGLAGFIQKPYKLSVLRDAIKGM